MPIKLVIADDHDLVRSGLKSLVTSKDIKVVGEATTGEEAVRRVIRARPNVLLMDVMMPEIDGLDALEKIREKSPKTKTVMMSAYENPTYIARAIALGAQGFVSKEASSNEIIAAIKAAHNGEPPPEDSMMAMIRENLITRYDPSEDEVPLTKREYQVLRHLAFGLSNREIGYSLEISIETVKEHVQNILRKLDAQDRTEAAVWAVKRGLVEVA